MFLDQIDKSLLVDFADQQNYLTELGFSQAKFKLREVPFGKCHERFIHFAVNVFYSLQLHFFLENKTWVLLNDCDKKISHQFLTIWQFL